MNSDAAQPARPLRETDELDELTLRRAARAEPAACRAVVVCYERRVFALIGRMLEPRGLGAAVEDLAQETFLRVFRHLDGFDHGAGPRPSTWILTIATRLTIDRIRADEKRPDDDTWRRPALGVVERPDEAHARREQLRAAQAAIAELRPEHQAVLVLRAFHDLDYAEIGAALDLATGTVKSRLARARAQLRARLGEAR